MQDMEVKNQIAKRENARRHNDMLNFHLLQFGSLFSCLAFSRPAFSTPPQFSILANETYWASDATWHAASVTYHRDAPSSSACASPIISQLKSCNFRSEIFVLTCGRCTKYCTSYMYDTCASHIVYIVSNSMIRLTISHLAIRLAKFPLYIKVNFSWISIHSNSQIRTVCEMADSTGQIFKAKKTKKR